MKFLHPIVLSFLFIMCSNTNAQTGKKFWFVAPDAIHAHGDEPLYFRITTFDKAASVTISMPANSGFTPISKNIADNTFATIEVKRNSVENQPANKVNNKGILIESTSNITVYYEIANDGNPDKFTLKGDNGLGKEFYVPSQNVFGNMAKYKRNANEKVDVVATKDNTVVTILPTVDVTGHKKGIPYQINLNRGQTYCIEYRDISATASMAGTYITSNNPIAVTISDDSIFEETSAYDIIGDQLIPTSIIGLEYIAVKTSTEKKAVQKVFVLATEDDTYVFINNDNNLVRHLMRGQLTEFDITDNAIYINATRPIYAYQVSGLANVNTTNNANEIGSALLPSIDCTGSSKVAFTRVFARSFWVQILTQNKNRNNFTMYDNNKSKVDYIDNLKWIKVKGTDSGDSDEIWYSAIVNMNISTGVPYTIENTNGLFHLSILDENDPRTSVGSVSYGYFSSYGRMHVEGPTQECEGKEIVLTTSTEMSSYRWFSKTTGNAILSTDRECRVNRSDTYWVTAQTLNGGCTITDSLDVNFVLPDISLGHDTIVCPGEVVTYALPLGYPSYQWSNSDTDNSTSVNVDAGFSETISVKVTDKFGCEADDEVVVKAFDVPVIQLNRTILCRGQRVINTTTFDKYQWEFKGEIINTDPTKNFITPAESGKYTLTAWSADGCAQTKDFDIVVNELPSFTLNDEWSCDNSSKRIYGPIGVGYRYLWSTGATTSHIDLTSPADFTLQVTDANGCVDSAKAHFDWYDLQAIDLGEDREECVGIDLVIDGAVTHTNFVWKYKKTPADSDVTLPTPNPANSYQIANAVIGNSGIYMVEGIDKNGCPVADTVNVNFYSVDPPVLKIEQNLCAGEQIQIQASNGYDTYKWLHNEVEMIDNQNVIEVSVGGIYKLEASYGGCIKKNEINVTSYALPTVKVSDDFSICKGDTGKLSMISFSSPEGYKFDYLTWNNHDKKYYDPNSVYVVTKAGNYTVTAYDEHGCSASDQTDVGVFAPTVMGQIPPVKACENIGVTLTNTLASALSYQWYKMEAATDVAGPVNAPWPVTQSGTYGLHVIDANGCPSQTERIVTILPVPTLNLGSDVDLCEGESAILKSPEVYAAYQWNGNPMLNTSSITVQSTGTYALLVKNVEGCESQDQVIVTLRPSPVFDLPNQQVCPGTYVSLTVPAGISDFEWSSGETTPSITVGKGNYWLKAKNNYGCVGVDTARVVWYPVPQISLGADTLICPVDELQLDAGAGFASYKWHNGSSAQQIIAQMQDTVNLVQVQNEYGCYGFASKTVRKLFRPDINLCSDTSVCQKDTFDIDAGVDYISYLWNNGSTEQTIRVSEPGEYWVEVTDGCMIIRDTANVVYQELPIITHLDTTIYARVAVLVEGGTGPYSYSINNSPKGAENVFENLKSGEHVIEIEDYNGCKAMATVFLSADFDVAIPPFFTPNNDGVNDRWEIEGIEKFPDTIIKIYDRYGKLLIKYLGSDPGWDGRYYGQPVPTDDYWYVVEQPLKRKMLKGHITLKR